MAATQAELQWISLDLNTKGYHISKTDRTIIKRQAMAQVGSRRRQRGNHGQINKLQYPVFTSNEKARAYEAICSENNAAMPKRQERYGSESPQQQMSSGTMSIPIPALMPLAAWERATTFDGVSLFQLWTWTDIRLGQAASSLIHHSRHPMVPLLREPKRHLNHIPDRYGQSECLDHAIQALIAKVRELIDPENSSNQASVLISYGQALRTVQREINRSEYHLQPDLLCAIDILSLVEILSKSGKNKWAQHVNGASLLIKIKGPAGFETPYEKDIALSLVTPITCECFRRNEMCFFEEQCWQDFLDSLRIPRSDSCSERHNMSLQSRKVMSRLPGLFSRVSSIVCHDRDASATTLLPLIADIHDFHQENYRFYNEVKNLCTKPGVALHSSTNIEFLYDLLATSLIGVAAPNRLLSALGDPQGQVLEDKALKYSREVLKLKADTILANGWASFHLSARASIGKSILKTTATWETTPGEIIEKWRFDEWCKALRVLTCNCKIA